MALYHPEHGYYSSGKAAIGRTGDFITSVSVGRLFGRLLAHQFVEMWERLGRPAPFTIVEQGAHKGDFAADVLEFLREFFPDCFAATDLCIVEPFALRRTEQQMRLAGFGPEKVRWASRLKDLEEFDGVHFSNELLDAFPVHRLHWTGEGWMERCVDFQEEGFVWQDQPLTSDALRAQAERIPLPLPAGYETEVGPVAHEWLTLLSQKIRRGWVLIVDYGYPRAEYYRAERIAGTLTGYSHHQRVDDPLAAPGDIDLTAHVDFTSLAETAEQHGLRVAGFTDQHHFIVGLSPLHFSDQSQLSAVQERELREFKTLMHPNLMGASFKALCLEKRGAGENGAPLAGFHFCGNARAELFP